MALVALGAGTRVVAAALVLYLARRYGAAPAMRMVAAVRDKLPALPVVRTNQRPKHFRAFAQDWHLRKHQTAEDEMTEWSDRAPVVGFGR